MTGGQPVDGPLTPQDIARQVMAEGVSRLVVVSDEPAKYPAGYFDASVAIHGRDELDRVQRTLRDVSGTTVLLSPRVQLRHAEHLRLPVRPFARTAVSSTCSVAPTAASTLGKGAAGAGTGAFVRKPGTVSVMSATT